MAAGILSATVALADYEQDIVRQLQDMGFARVEVSRTLLGRVRITAIGADGTREIILNPNTGEILRDLWLRQDGRASDRALLEGASRDDGRSDGRSGSNGSSGSDDDDDSNDDSGSNSGSSGGRAAIPAAILAATRAATPADGPADRTMTAARTTVAMTAMMTDRPNKAG